MSTSDCSASTVASATSSAASSVQPPVNTASRANSASLRVVEQVVAPGERGAERLLARVGVAAAGEQVEPRAQALEQLLGRKHAHTSRRQLEREREVVELRADLLDCWSGDERRIGRAARER